MKVIRAKHLGMCFGVRDAISLALAEAKKNPITIFGELVHNKTVLESMRQHGVAIEPKAEALTTKAVMITAHGASDGAIRELKQRGFNVTEATCPLVHFAHRAVQRFVAEGFHPVIIGKRDHVEVRGLTGDLTEYDVVLTEDDVARLAPRPRFGVSAQTTQPISRVHHLVELIRARFPESELRFADTVCQPTKQRQDAAVELARQCDAVVVVGGGNSNNTRELVNTCRQFNPRVFHVELARDLRPEWFTGVETVGLTAGTSTPDDVIDAIERRLQEMVSEDGTGEQTEVLQHHGGIPVAF